ncbi:MAG TPA: phosphonate utilization associated transcriptional regulator [Casimicrobiaceae bacterium]|nr:phosphonate utilization associated transcriptional regulator [Casimicrobiaceae bacterium]
MVTTLPSTATRPAATHALALVRSNSLPGLVRQELERMILAGELAAGAKLTEAALAARLGVSRGPVREAFRALEEIGLVRVEKNRGVFVRSISVEEADEIYEVRAILDEWIGRRLAQVATAEQIAAWRIDVERLEKAASRNDIDGYYHLNLEFHDRLVAACGNAKLSAAYRRLVKELSLFRRQTLARAGTMSVSTREHREIVERIAARNVAAAGRAMLEHVQASRERMHESHPHGAGSAARRPAAASRARRSR